MGDDWQPGDLALCVDAKPSTGIARTRLAQGRLYTVLGVGVCPTGRKGLVLEGFYWARGFTTPFIGAYRFRKIRPLSDEERREAIRELQGDKPAQVPA